MKYLLLLTLLAAGPVIRTIPDEFSGPYIPDSDVDVDSDSDDDDDTDADDDDDDSDDGTNTDPDDWTPLGDWPNCPFTWYHAVSCE